MPSSIKKSLYNCIQKFAVWLPQQWQAVSWPQFLLLPISLIFSLLVRLRRLLYRWGIIKQVRLPVPVVVVGNITVGGAGKTPLTIALVNKLKTLGLKPGVISRGYGRETNSVLAVKVNNMASEVGDEPLLIARRTECPVFVGANRIEAGKALLNAHPNCNIIISDDGLQHYRMVRDYEIVVVDGGREFGNQWMLPAGPLREPMQRLDNVDAIVYNLQSDMHKREPKSWQDKCYNTQLAPADFYQLLTPEREVQASHFSQKKITAVAGIGHPQRFFDTLSTLGLRFKPMAFADHQAYDLSDFQAIDADVVIVTEKDAVKCEAFADERFWVLPVSAELPASLITALIEKLQQLEEDNH